jgi:hypothetical protein
MISRVKISGHREDRLTYGLTTTRSGAEVTVSGKSRDEVFRDAIAATLEMAYGGAPPTGQYDGDVVPIQAAGDDDLSMLKELLDDCLRAVHAASGTLHPPRWMAYDSGRVTANLPMTSPEALRRDVSVARVSSSAGADSYDAHILFTVAAAH